MVGGRLHRTVASTVQWKGPNLGSDVGYRGLFCGSRSWSSVPYSGPLQVYPHGRRTLLWTIWVRHSLGWGDGRVCPHQRLSRKAQAWLSKGFHNAEGPRSTLDTIEGRRWNGYQACITLRILGVLFCGATSSPIRTCGWSQDWWVSEWSEQSHAGFLGNNE